ncbi:MAG: cytochrome C oxidase subunit II [Pseudonocardiaceae bacterium]|nr:cytochrome C oxidase subunit II [Pseudonocardiaceae bacterium]
MVDVVRSRAGRPLKVALIAVAALLATGCSVDDALGFGWPDGVTPQAERMRELWIWSALAALIVGVIVWGLILWTVVFHRKRTDEMPRQTQYNLPLEIFYTVVPFVIVAVLFYFTATTQNFVQAKVDDPDLRVEVVGFQWNWEFQYLQEQRNGNGEFVPMQTQAGTPLSTVGSPNTIALLVVPTERVVEYRLLSTDVLHAFFVPEFLFKRDVFPNPEKNNTDNVFQTTVERQGAFVGRCAELCGTYHSQMLFEMRALPGDLFDRYMDIRARINPVTRQPFTAGEALQQLDCGPLCAPEAVTTSPFDTARSN